MSLPDYPVLLLWAILLLTVPFPWLMAACFSAVFHELCHLLCICLVKARFHHFRLIPDGAVIDATFSSPKSELLCALAGPLGSFLLVWLHPWFPRTALCAMAQGLFNLLPVYPLDGGRALRCLLEIHLPDQAKRIFSFLETGFLWILAVASFFCWICFSSGLPFFILVTVLLRKRKIPCKEQKIRVQ